MKKDKITAVVLAAGQGKRMNSKIAKQYLLLNEKPILYYSLKTFEESEVDEIILVVGQGEGEYVKEHIVDLYSFKKISKIIEGGKERYNSVFNALNVIHKSNYVLIHDGARPLITVDIISRLIQIVKVKKACITGMPVKDTIKIVGKNKMVVSTPARETLWSIQTPQAFEFNLILKAYEKMMQEDNIFVTDDAMILEHTMDSPIHLMEGSYHNIKITTAEDIQIAETFLKEGRI